ncbi:MAG: BREX system ATP-binding domain-containing protein [Candidatus Micrarchaeota archaeon]
MQNVVNAAKPPNPFNSSSPIDPSDFAGRIKELENFSQKLRQTTSGSLASMAVAGGYGIGKTSFLHKCKSIAQEQRALTIYFSLNELDKLDRESLASILIARIRDKVEEEVILQRLSRKVLDIISRIKIKTLQDIEISLTQSNKEEHPSLQSALTASWKAISSSHSAIVFLIDEAAVLEKNRADLILYLRAVLEQLQIEKVPVMIVPAGKLSISGPSGTGFSPLVRTFPPVMLENFSQIEANYFIEKKLKPLGISIDENALKKIYNLTEGHPYVLTAYMNAVYDKLQGEEEKITEAHLKATDVEFVSTILAPFFSRFYDQAGKTSKEILSLMSTQKGESTISEMCKHLKKENNELSPHLAKLVQDGAIIRVDRGKYKLFHGLLATYITSTAIQGIFQTLKK